MTKELTDFTTELTPKYVVPDRWVPAGHFCRHCRTIH